MQFINGTRAEDLTNDGIFAKQRAVIPFWALALSASVKRLARLAARLVRTLWRHPLTTAALFAVALVWVEFGRQGLLGVLGLTMLSLTAWLWRSPATFDRRVVRPVRGWWRWLTFYRLVWYPVMHGTGLTRTTPDRTIYTPTVTSVSSTRVVDTIGLRLIHGHTPEDFHTQAEGLRHAFRAHRLTVVETAPGLVELRVFAKDPLTRPIPATPIERISAVPDLLSLPVGLTEAGEVYRVPLLGDHKLIAGKTGAGKGSVQWSILRALGPGIASGLVCVTGLDPKGGMELYPGRALFAYYGDQDGEQMAQVIEAAADRMTARAKRLRDAGLRKHVPTVDDPCEVIVIDEVAFLTAYHPDRKIRDRVKAALSLLLSQGRAPGFSVIASLQDPRKETLPFRDLFPTRIALRLAEDSHTDMVLGDGAQDLGAACHLIPDTLPGVGYVRTESANEPVRVRFSWISDDDITDMATRWPAPAPVSPGARVIDLAARDRTAGSGLPGQRPVSGIESDSPPGA
ncbi:cell division protein FtsK [Spongisporangium articulatum]|uniref:Cell division protein FtsK n=1 Tax=Spongisporangium articulatum TaxID=3362603 RepID=A0ABW8AIT3_9ACTN